MQQGDGLRGRAVRLEPIDDGVDPRVVLVLGRVPALGPAGELALDEAIGMAQAAQAGGFRVDLVERGERVDDHLADAPGEHGIALEARRQVGADDDAVAPLHDVERGADDARVLAQEIAARRQRIDAP